MKHIRIITRSLAALTLVLGLGACSSDELSEAVPEQNGGRHTLKMNFEGRVVGFDEGSAAQAAPRSRATSSTWSEGDKIYISFTGGDKIVPGVATYSAADGWTVSYDGVLSAGSQLKCSLRHFQNATDAGAIVALNSNTAVYEDTLGVYTYEDGTLTVSGTLAPKTGRIRFSGTPGDSIRVRGITTFTTFSPANDQAYTSDALVKLTVDSNGYTPYVYGSFTSDDRTLAVITDSYACSRTCGASVYKTGESGYMTIPTETAHNGWTSGLSVTASGVTFKMVPVTGFSGGFYLLAETETTNELYAAVMGTSTTTSTLQKPANDKTYSSYIAFINKLNAETKLTFSMPTTDQWLYAAKGGKYTQGFTYAGSNSADDVAWYANNCTLVQDVKTKAPNELGLYDMSGNVGEFVSTMYSPSTTSTYLYPYICGGGYKSSAQYIQSDSMMSTYDSSSLTSAGYSYTISREIWTSSSCYDIAIGLRLCLTIN